MIIKIQKPLDIDAYYVEVIEERSTLLWFKVDAEYRKVDISDIKNENIADMFELAQFIYINLYDDADTLKNKLTMKGLPVQLDYYRHCCHCLNMVKVEAAYQTDDGWSCCG